MGEPSQAKKRLKRPPSWEWGKRRAILGDLDAPDNAPSKKLQKGSPARPEASPAEAKPSEYAALASEFSDPSEGNF